VLTPDTLLALCSALAYYAYWRLEEVRDGRMAMIWGALLGVGVGLGALAKGPAILVMAAPLGLLTSLRRRSASWPLEPGYSAAVVVFVALTAPWFAYISGSLDGAAGYLLDNQAFGRLVLVSCHRLEEVLRRSEVRRICRARAS
jgi:4-amino-4-deoxy-L-arabinose transferase-like glycosyltransferase